MKKYILISFLIHLLPIFFLFNLKPIIKDEQKKQDTQKSYNITILESKAAKRNNNLGFLPKKKSTNSNKEKSKKTECTSYYGGIGISIDFGLMDRITEVHSGYPGDLGGLKVNDYIIHGEEITGEVGTSVSVTILRDGLFHTFNFIRKKICYN